METTLFSDTEVTKGLLGYQAKQCESSVVAEMEGPFKTCILSTQ